jgi:NAD(P)H-hydrate repair Nnr-like enzyme with NAD(P)H-hydrate dehydratase domain
VPLVVPAGPRLLTPHGGEAAHLLGRPREAVESDRLAAVRDLRARAPTILKGTHPLVSGAPIRAFRGGVPQLGTGGSGDVLAGACGAVLARAAVQGAFGDPSAATSRVEACAAEAVVAHLAAGRRAGPVGVTASEIADALVPRS